MGKMQRQKGKSFERSIANEFKAVYPATKRTLTQQRDSGEAPDIDAPGLWVEAKFHRKVPIRKAFEQAVDEVSRAKSTATPVAVTKDNGKEILATLRLSDFLALLKQVQQVQQLEARVAGRQVPDFSAPEYAPWDEPNVAPAGAPNVLVLAQP